MIQGRKPKGEDRHSGGDALARGKTSIRVVVVCFMLSVLLLLVLVFVPSDRTEPGVLIVLLGMVLVTALALKSRMESPDYFEIIYPISFLYFLSFFYRGVVLIANPADLNPFVNGFSAINKALGFGLLGLISMWLGYYCLSSKPGRHITALVNWFLPDEWRANKAIIRILFLFIAGLSLQIIGIFSAMGQASNAGVSSGSVSSFFGLFAYLSNISLVLFSLFIFRRRASEGNMILVLMVWCGMLSSQVLVALITGARGSVLITLFIIPAISYNYARKHLSMKWLAVYALIMLVILLVVIMPLQGPFRQARIFYSSGSFSEYLRTVRQVSYKRTLGDQLSEFSQRQIILENFAISISKTPSIIPFKNGGTLLSTLSNFIPRSIWRKRVAYSLDRVFSTEYAGWSENSKGATGVTNIGELYINFGITGIVIGMFVLGLLYRTVYKNLIGIQAVGDLRILVYYSFLMCFTWIEGSLGYLFFNLILETIVLIAVLLLLRINVRIREQPNYS